MKKYKIQITNKALSDMEEIYNYITEQLKSPKAAMEQCNRLASAIETLDIYPERVKLIDAEEELALGLRQIRVDNYSIIFHIREDRIIITNVLYGASDITKRLRDS